MSKILPVRLKRIEPAMNKSTGLKVYGRFFIDILNDV
jgi:hypothetical protein